MTQPTSSRIRSRFPQIPTGDTVASYSSYEDAMTAIDQLARNEGFSIEAISIVGSDLKSVERVTGRMSSWRAALGGAMSGIMMGLFFGAVMMLLDPTSNIAVLAGIVLLATVFGGVWGLISYAVSPQKREFTSAMQVTASRFDVIVPRELGAQARQILGGAGGAHLAPATPVVPAPQVPAPDASAPVAPPSGSAEVPADALAEPAPPATPPRTYGEMQDELRRREREGGS
ncbi:hypothetical protein EG850_00100 [Gulosibacter macacae]|uniref:General stress protein 17M-like domain-containing protein n=1 Tax=Gulosibacter macacae TaxID=2488791 RepID=A0A3P3W0K2_9MICO|nr:general stress protein [Gulosibacter macacae]RRJ88591.1 hypothetical protein EG850_00100 [Gulosibacter macacae]